MSVSETGRRPTLATRTARARPSSDRSPPRPMPRRPRFADSSLMHASESSESFSKPNLREQQWQQESDDSELVRDGYPATPAAEYRKSDDLAEGWRPRLSPAEETLRLQVDRLRREMEDDARSINATGCDQLQRACACVSKCALRIVILYFLDNLRL